MCVCVCVCLCEPLPLQWLGDGINDMFADAVLAVVLQIESTPGVSDGEWVWSS